MKIYTLQGKIALVGKSLIYLSPIRLKFAGVQGDPLEGFISHKIPYSSFCISIFTISQQGEIFSFFFPHNIFMFLHATEIFFKKWLNLKKGKERDKFLKI